MKALFYLLFARGWIRRGCCIFVSFKKGTVSSQCPPISSKNLKTLQPLQIKETEVFRGQNAGKRFKIKGKQLPSTSVQRLFSAVYRPDSLNSSKSSGGDTVRVRPPLPAPNLDADFDTICVIFFCTPLNEKAHATTGWTASFTRLQDFQ
ncbi:MAG: hypothetical protein IKR49_09170 [Clostridia bacterium]|nr:hypothetical protein [Clostridia bacterium]